ncbi:MAG: hypothetical protein M3511_01325 [Deinococcota bacterium]|jgi:hypothetical protein|nr:hypothetical protein [Deinococcota bacterium]
MASESTNGNQATASPIRFQLVTPEGTLEELTQSLEAKGATIDSSKKRDVSQEAGPESVLLVVVAAIGIAQLANYLWQNFRGGVIIDGTKDPIEIMRNRDIPGSKVIVFTKDGVKTEYIDVNELKFKELITAVSGGSGGA